MNKSIIITTINEKTKGIIEFQRILSDWEIIIIGDLKSKEIEEANSLKYYNVEKQLNTGFFIVEKSPYNHYSRKNIGYILALKNGAEYIYDTDDDNIPYEDWVFPSFRGEFDTVTNAEFFNVYNFYTKENVWPRGYPLTKILDNGNSIIKNTDSEIAVWQGLADLDPDVDAIYRLTIGKLFNFSNLNPPLVLGNYVYCPFNSQNTIWKREMMPYAYLPSTVTFRFTDILRGYVAQRCFWEHNLKLGFCKPTVFQERNSHNLINDFISEIPCYTRVEELVGLLNNISLCNDPFKNLTDIYNLLEKHSFVDRRETEMIGLWNKDVEKYL